MPVCPSDIFSCSWHKRRPYNTTVRVKPKILCLSISDKAMKVMFINFIYLTRVDFFFSFWRKKMSFPVRRSLSLSYFAPQCYLSSSQGHPLSQGEASSRGRLNSYIRLLLDYCRHTAYCDQNQLLDVLLYSDAKLKLTTKCELGVYMLPTQPI